MAVMLQLSLKEISQRDSITIFLKKNLILSEVSELIHFYEISNNNNLTSQRYLLE